MINTYAEIRTDILKKLGVSTTSTFYTDAIIGDWIQQATRWATSFKKWPFTEGRVSTTWAGTEELTFEGYKADSFRILTIGGKRHEKLNFEDYLIFKEETPSSDERVFSDFGRVIFVNPNTDASGTLTAYGQYTPVDIDITDESATTVFSNGDEEGNSAIVEKVLEFAKLRERKMNEAEAHRQRAEAILEGIEGIIEDEQFNYKTHKTRGGMWKRFDVIEGDLRDDLFNRDQF